MKSGDEEKWSRAPTTLGQLWLVFKQRVGDLLATTTTLWGFLTARQFVFLIKQPQGLLERGAWAPAGERQSARRRKSPLQSGGRQGDKTLKSLSGMKIDETLGEKKEWPYHPGLGYSFSWVFKEVEQKEQGKEKNAPFPPLHWGSHWNLRRGTESVLICSLPNTYVAMPYSDRFIAKVLGVIDKIVKCFTKRNEQHDTN